MSDVVNRNASADISWRFGHVVAWRAPRFPLARHRSWFSRVGSSLVTPHFLSAARRRELSRVAPQSAAANRLLVRFAVALTLAFQRLHHARDTRQKNFAGNFPKIKHSQKNEISNARIVWRSNFFVLVSHAATKKTDCTNVGAMLLIAAIVGFAN
jgi:hypothetical protein